jgi:hypothetical protein
MKRLFFITALLTSLLACSEKITRVSVRDQEFREIKVLSTQSELSRFEEIWSKRTKQDTPSRIEWPFKLDIRDSGSAGSRWMYNPEGWTQLLSVKETPLYKLSSPEDLNKLLGLPKAR